MKKTLLTVAFALTMGLSSFAQGYYTQYYADKALVAKATEWVKSGEWRNGYNGAAPHFSVNAVDFYQQYHKNPQQWQALFRWLAKTDHNGPLETKRSESHNHKIDFQFVVKGVEKFGIIDHYTSKPNSKYRPDVIHYDYDASKARFYLSNPKEFFLFFPRDWHIAKINNDLKTPECPDENIRVIVVKVDYVD